jgi:hypothetical protein
MTDENHEDLSGLKKTVAALRSENSALESRLREYEGLDPTAARDALSSLPELQAKNQELLNQLHGVKLDYAAGQVTVGVSPEYRDPLYSYVRQQLQVGEDGSPQTVDGRSLQQLAEDVRSKYQGFFLPTTPQPVGADVQPAAPPSVGSAPQTVSASDLAAIAKLDPKDVASGKIVIEP